VVQPMKLTVPEASLVLLVGASGSGKSTFADRHFLSTAVLSSDHFRGLVSDDETNQEATEDAFAALHFVAARRLANRRLTVIDATNVQTRARRPLLELAREHEAPLVAIVLNLAEDICIERDRNRGNRRLGPQVIRRQALRLRQSLRSLPREGFRYVYILTSPEEVDVAEVELQRSSTNPLALRPCGGR
jgi:protein phosphatase